MQERVMTCRTFLTLRLAINELHRAEVHSSLISLIIITTIVRRHAMRLPKAD